MATIIAAGSGGNWAVGGTWVGGVVPTSADDVVLDASSGNVIINAAASARSLDCTGYTGTLTHNASVTLSIGDATAGAGNVAFRLSATMTAYTVANAATSAISFVSTSATQQTITSAGKTMGSWTISGAGSSYQLTDANTTSSAASVVLAAGTLNTNSQTCNWGAFVASGTNARTLTLGASAVTVSMSAASGTAWVLNTTTNLTLNSGTSTITATGGANAAVFNFSSGALAYGNVVFAGSGMTRLNLSSGVSFVNLTRTGTAAKTDGLSTNSSGFTVTGTLTLNGNSATNRLLVASDNLLLGTGRLITCNGSVVASNVDFQDIIAAGSASWNLSAISGGAGDCGGNTGITFTPAATQTHAIGGGTAWSANSWTTRVPLPQDDVIITGVSGAGYTIVADMPRLGKNITFAGSSGGLSVDLSTAASIFGSLNLTDLPTMGSSTAAWTFAGRGSYTITMAGKTFAKPITVAAPTGTYTLQDALTITNTLLITFGTLQTNNQTLSVTTATVTGATATLALAASTVNLTSTAATSVLVRSSSAALTSSGATIVIATASANARTISVRGNGNSLATSTVSYTLAGSTGALIISGSSTPFGTINFSDASNARTLTFASSTTFTVTNFNVSGTPGNLVTINSSTPGSAATLSKAAGTVSCDYLSLQDSTATGGASWYAGPQSVRGTNVTGWFFTSSPNFMEFV